MTRLISGPTKNLPVYRNVGVATTAGASRWRSPQECLKDKMSLYPTEKGGTEIAHCPKKPPGLKLCCQDKRRGVSWCLLRYGIPFERDSLALYQKGCCMKNERFRFTRPRGTPYWCKYPRAGLCGPAPCLPAGKRAAGSRYPWPVLPAGSTSAWLPVLS